MLAAGLTLSMDLLEQSRGGQRTRPDIRGAAGSDSPDSPISRDSRPSQSPSLDLTDSQSGVSLSFRRSGALARWPRTVHCQSTHGGRHGVKCRPQRLPILRREKMKKTITIPGAVGLISDGPFFSLSRCRFHAGIFLLSALCAFAACGDGGVEPSPPPRSTLRSASSDDGDGDPGDRHAACLRRHGATRRASARPGRADDGGDYRDVGEQRGFGRDR